MSALVDLGNEVAKLTADGYRVTFATATTVQLVKPKEFNLAAACAWLLLFGIGLLVYVLYYVAKEDDVVTLNVTTRAMTYEEHLAEARKRNGLPADGAR